MVHNCNQANSLISMGLIVFMRSYLGPRSDFHQIWAMEVFSSSSTAPIFGIQNAEMKKKKGDVITSVLYMVQDDNLEKFKYAPGVYLIGLSTLLL